MTLPRRDADPDPGTLMRLVVLLAIALGFKPGVAAAQESGPFSTFRQLHGETRLRASLEYAAGALRVAPGRPTELYRMDLAFDGDRFAPISDYDAAQSAVSLGLRRGGTGGIDGTGVSVGTYGALWTFSAASYVKLDGLTFKNSGASCVSLIGNATHLDIGRLDLSNCHYGGALWVGKDRQFRRSHASMTTRCTTIRRAGSCCGPGRAATTWLSEIRFGTMPDSRISTASKSEV